MMYCARPLYVYVCVSGEREREREREREEDDHLPFSLSQKLSMGLSLP